MLTPPWYGHVQRNTRTDLEDWAALCWVYNVFLHKFSYTNMWASSRWWEMFGVLKPGWFWRNIVCQCVITVALAPPLHLSQRNTSTGARNPAPLLLHCLKSSLKKPQCFLCGWRGVVAASSEDEDVTIHFWGWTKHLVMLFGSLYAFVCVWREKERSAPRRNRIPQFWFSTWEVPSQACENLWLSACCLKKCNHFPLSFPTSCPTPLPAPCAIILVAGGLKKSNEDWAVTGGSQNKREAGFGVFLFFNHQNHFFYPSVISMQRLRLAWKDGWRQHCSCDVALDLWDDPVQVHYSLWFIKLCILSFGEVTPLLSEQLCVCRSFLIARILF